jgi:hypothetical protein
MRLGPHGMAHVNGVSSPKIVVHDLKIAQTF